jgi:hypothetical protein
MRFFLRAAKPEVNNKLRQVQLFTSAGLAFSHGADDAQNSMGFITMFLLLGGFVPEFDVPFWLIVACASAITLGIISGGWRIVRTVGVGIYKVRPLHAFDAQLTSASVIFGASMFGAPISTTHVVSYSIMGIGASERPKAMRWAKAKEIVSAESSPSRGGHRGNRRLLSDPCSVPRGMSWKTDPQITSWIWGSQPTATAGENKICAQALQRGFYRLMQSSHRLGFLDPGE